MQHIVWLGIGALLLCFGLVGRGQQHRGASPLVPLPAGTTTLQMDNVSGGKQSLADFKGKVVLLSVVGKSSNVSDPAGVISGEMSYAFASKPDFARIMVVELTGFPGVMHSFIQGRAKSQYDQDEAELTRQFKKRGLICLPRHHNTLLLDFDGDLGQKLGVSDKVDEAYQMYVLDRQGRIVLHVAQGKNKAEEAHSLDLVRQALTRAFNAKK